MKYTTKTTRQFLRDHKSIFDTVKNTGNPIIIINRKEPQVGIVPLQDLEKIEQVRKRESLDRLMKLAEEIWKDTKDMDLPNDLSTNHNYYTWGGEKDGE